MAMLAALTSLAACGGGGGGAAPTPPPPPPAPAPAPTSSTPIAAQLSVPTPVGYDADRLAAFNRLNEIRLAAGLGMLAQNVAMDRAAQAHAEWMVANDSFTHEEVAGTAGFTGVSWPLRDEAFGYLSAGGTEVMAERAYGAEGVDVLVNMVYHRAGMLAFEPVDVGIGWSARSAASISRPLVIDMTRPGTDPIRGLGQAAEPRISGVAIWPMDGALGVPLRLGLEIPNPVPGSDVLSLGTPPSITVDPLRTLAVATFTLTDASIGAVVPTTLLTGATDPHSLLPSSFAAAVPLGVLKPSTTYRVVFSAQATDVVFGTREEINRAWSFTTAAQ
jgi:hypothetical protein